MIRFLLVTLHCVAYSWVTNNGVLVLSPISIATRSRSHFSIGLSSNDQNEQKSQLFNQLADAYGVKRLVTLGDLNEIRGLIALQDIAANADALVVPGNICLWTDRNGIVRGLPGQTELSWEQAGDIRLPIDDENVSRGLTWDVRLALALHDATADPSIGGQFWDLYGRLFPPPHDITVPLCMPLELLMEMQHEQLAARAQAQKLRLTSLFPRMMKKHSSHRATAFYDELGSNVALAMPFALQWTFALVRSRAFVADHDNLAFVPFLDMANHDFQPNSNFTYDSANDCFKLVTLRNISAGSELLISYSQSLNNERLAAQYGFISNSNLNPCTLADSDPNRPCLMSEEGFAEFEALLLSIPEEFLEDKSYYDLYQKHDMKILARQVAKQAAALDSSPLKALLMLKDVLKEYADTEFSTSLKDDIEMQLELESGSNGIDERLMFAIKYRIHRKAMHFFALELIEQILMSNSSIK